MLFSRAFKNPKEEQYVNKLPQFKCFQPLKLNSLKDVSTAASRSFNPAAIDSEKVFKQSLSDFTFQSSALTGYIFR
jgi:hypothetical protein